MTEINVRYGKVSDVNGMIKLDQKLYPGAWQVESTFVERLLERNKRVYKILEENGELRGYSSLIPLDKRTFDQLLSGQIDESKICHHALAYKKGREVYIYFSSIIVDIFHENRKKYRRALILELLDWIEDIQETGVVIKEFGMIAITDAGNRVCQRMGFNKVWEVKEHDETYNVFKGTVEDVRNGIKVDNCCELHRDGSIGLTRIRPKEPSETSEKVPRFLVDLIFIKREENRTVFLTRKTP